MKKISSSKKKREEISIFYLFVQDSHALVNFGVGKTVEDFISFDWVQVSEVILNVSSDSPGKINVFLQNSDSISMNGTKLRVFKKTNKISFS